METALKNARDSTHKTASGGDMQRFPALKRIDERQDNQQPTVEDNNTNFATPSVSLPQEGTYIEKMSKETKHLRTQRKEDTPSSGTIIQTRTKRESQNKKIPIWFTANHPTKYKQDAARCDQVEGLLRAPQVATIRPISDHVAQLIRSIRCWFYGGRKTGEPGEKPSKHGRDQLQQLYSHKFQVRESTRGYTQVVIHPAITPSDQA